MSLLFMCIKQKSDFFNNKIYILVILADFYASLSWFFCLLPGSGSTCPEVDPDPTKGYGSETLISILDSTQKH